MKNMINEFERVDSKFMIIIIIINFGMFNDAFNTRT